jgi:hypothetical protein
MRKETKRKIKFKRQKNKLLWKKEDYRYLIKGMRINHSRRNSSN